ncbi:MAG: hypothetical protein Q9222_003104 [Ikaeria aurantiellina]
MNGQNCEQVKGKGYLSQPLTSSDIPLPTRHAIANSLFQTTLTIAEFSSLYNGLQAWFADWVEYQCPAAANQISAKTYDDLLQIIKLLQSLGQTTIRDDIATRLCDVLSSSKLASNSAENDTKYDASLTLAARLWLSTSVDSLEHTFTPSRFVRWQKDQCLSDALGKELCPKPQSSQAVNLPKVFSAANLERIAGIKIQWTSSLVDHLVLKDNDKTVMFFHQASFLEFSRLSKTTLLSDELIGETLQTMALLIPSNESYSRRWFKKRLKGLALDPKAGAYPALSTSARQIEKFHYWRDRLIILKQAFDDTDIDGFRSLWYDDRIRVQWYTYWVAVAVLLLTIIFGFIQSVTGIVQALATVRTSKQK